MGRSYAVLLTHLLVLHVELGVGDAFDGLLGGFAGPHLGQDLLQHKLNGVVAHCLAFFQLFYVEFNAGTSFDLLLGSPLSERRRDVGLVRVGVFPEFAQEDVPLLIDALRLPELGDDLAQSTLAERLKRFVAVVIENFLHEGRLRRAVHEGNLLEAIYDALQLLFSQVKLLQNPPVPMPQLKVPLAEVKERMVLVDGRHVLEVALSLGNLVDLGVPEGHLDLGHGGWHVYGLLERALRGGSQGAVGLFGFGCCLLLFGSFGLGGLLLLPFDHLGHSQVTSLLPHQSFDVL